MLKVYSLVSGSGDRVDIGAAENLDEATGLVYALDVRYAAWEAAGFPPLNDGDPLGSYEGCDVFAVEDDGTLMIYENDGEWALFEEGGPA